MNAAEILSARREAAGDPAGLLVLSHGRGADERDLLPLADLLDPGRRLLVVSPRGPLSLPPGGAHWYALYRLGFPDPETYRATYGLVSSWLDELVAETGLEWSRVALGGFSQGAVMTYALGLGADRPRPAALIALSGFIPSVPSFELDLSQPLPPVAIGHGLYDPVIGVEWSRQARETLEQAGAAVLYRESPMPHTIDPSFVDELRPWLEAALADG